VGQPAAASRAARLAQVSLVRRLPAHGARVTGWMRARRARAAAHVGGAHVAVVGTRRPARLEGVGRAGGAGAGAALRHVALARRRAAHRAWVPGGVRARRARAVAHVAGADVAVVRAGRAARLEGVRRAGGAGAGAALRHVALARRRAAHRAGGLDRVGRAGRTRPGTAFRRIVAVDRGATDRARRQEGVGAAVALVQRAGVGVGRAGGPGRLLGVGRAGGAGAGAGLGRVALARRRAAHRARVPGGVRARRARAVAHVAGADVAVVRAGRAARLEEVRRAGGARAVAGLGHVAFARRRPARRARVPRRVRAGGGAGA